MHENGKNRVLIRHLLLYRVGKGAFPDLPTASPDDGVEAHTDGVPLFIEELTKTAIESGLLREAMTATVDRATAATCDPIDVARIAFITRSPACFDQK
jgi:hypothetical protein